MTGSEGTNLGNGELILLVEDDPDVRDVLREVLTGLNYRVMIAANGQEALEAVADRQGDLDLVISDMVMPEMNGLDLFHSLSTHWPTAKVVMITGYPLGTGTRELLDRRRVAWIQKPVDTDTLAQVVRDMLDGVVPAQFPN